MNDELKQNVLHLTHELLERGVKIGSKTNDG